MASSQSLEERLDRLERRINGSRMPSNNNYPVTFAHSLCAEDYLKLQSGQGTLKYVPDKELEMEQQARKLGKMIADMEKENLELKAKLIVLKETIKTNARKESVLIETVEL